MYIYITAGIRVVGFIKVLAVATLGTAVFNSVGSYLETSEKANEEKMDAFYRAKFAAEAAAMKA